MCRHIYEFPPCLYFTGFQGHCWGGSHHQQQNECFKWNNLTLCCRHFLKYWKRAGDSINYCDFLKFIVFVRGGHCDYLPHMPTDLVMPLRDLSLNHHYIIHILIHHHVWLSPYRKMILTQVDNFKTCGIVQIFQADNVWRSEQ